MCRDCGVSLAYELGLLYIPEQPEVQRDEDDELGRMIEELIDTAPTIPGTNLVLLAY